MWPKALSSLIELAPHITRLVPLADRFFNSKASEADASRTAMQQMAEGLRGDLGQVTSSHAGLYRQLNDQNEKLISLSADLVATRRSVDAIDQRLTGVERLLSRVFYITAAALLLLIVILVKLLLHH
jgi:septal ring factor EnvC (AmiA/AmiB activator)